MSDFVKMLLLALQNADVGRGNDDEILRFSCNHNYQTRAQVMHVTMGVCTIGVEMSHGMLGRELQFRVRAILH